MFCLQGKFLYHFSSVLFLPFLQLEQLNISSCLISFSVLAFTVILDEAEVIRASFYLGMRITVVVGPDHLNCFNW